MFQANKVPRKADCIGPIIPANFSKLVAKAGMDTPNDSLSYADVVALISLYASTLQTVYSPILYGVQILQVYKPFVKAMVYTVFFLDTLQTVIFFRDAFEVFGYGFGDVAHFKKAHLSGFSVPILTGMAVALIQLIASIVEGVLVFKINDLANLQRLSFIQCTVWLAGSALCDTIIAVAMTYYLMRASNGVQSTNLLIKRLIRLVIETGTATVPVPYPFIHGVLQRVYANTLWVILNNRIPFGGIGTNLG
ncbi:hypothetical protein MPER_08314 [Moniliophthora perniciosa FA553]|nr:hypothetical protein MPER_08314 [Moniliophthora perniciosa FA553]